MATIDLTKFKNKAKLKDRYAKQLQRLQAEGRATDSIELAVNTAVANLAKTEASSLVIYGEPQSGKTEMMICLTAKLLDEGYSTIVHLMNDSVDLLTQNLEEVQGVGAGTRPARPFRTAPVVRRSESARIGRLLQEELP